jgi:hypothetical protein
MKLDLGMLLYFPECLGEEFCVCEGGGVLDMSQDVMSERLRVELVKFRPLGGRSSLVDPPLEIFSLTLKFLTDSPFASSV